MLTAAFRRALCALAALLLVTTARVWADGPVDIAHLAPRGSVFILSIPDFARFREGVDQSGLGALWREPEVQKFITEAVKEEMDKLHGFLKDLGVEADDLRAPTGAVGLAVFFPEPAGRDKDPAPAMLIVADMGEHAEAWEDTIDRLIDRGVKDKHIKTDEETYTDVRIRTISPLEPDNDDDDEEEFDWEDKGGLAEFLGLSPEHPMHLARRGNAFLVSTDLKALEAAIDAASGTPMDAAADNRDYRDALAQHPDGGVAHAVLLVQPLVEQLERSLAEDMEADGAAVGAILDVLGIKNIRAASVSLRLNTDDAMTETSMGVLVPEKKGLVALFAEPLGRFDPPGFVPPDAGDVTRFSFKFAGVYDLLRSVAQAMPEEQRGQFTAMLDQSVNMVKPVLDAAGPGIYKFTTYKQPLSSDSEQQVVVIDLRDQATVSSGISVIAGQGMFEPRDFEGNTIYTSDFVGFSVGVGFDRLFIGQTAGVENAMRLAGRADAPRISAEPNFSEATRSIPDDTVVAGYADLRQTLRWAYWSIENADKVLLAQYERMGIPEEDREEFVKSIRESEPEWMRKLPPIEVVLRHIGDMATEIRATPDGFRGRSITLRPSGN